MEHNYKRKAFISDLHIGTNKCQAKKLIQFLDEIRCGCIAVDQLFLVGDVVDLWVLDRQIFDMEITWTDEHSEIISKISELSKHIEVIFIPGNHDDFFRHMIDVGTKNLLGVKLMSSYSYINRAWEKVHVTHGDRHDITMKIPKELINFAGIFYDLAPEWVRKGSTFSDFLNDQMTASTERAASKWSKRKGFDKILCGHTHDPKISERYINTGSWATGNPTYVYEDDRGEFSLRSY